MTLTFPFDEVRIVDVPPVSLSPGEFFALPLAKRLRYVIAKTAVFLLGGVEVDASTVLAQVRSDRAAG
jgi:hypothetical protein